MNKRASQIAMGDNVQGYGIAECFAYVPHRQRRMNPAYAKTKVWVQFNGVLVDFNRSTVLTVLTSEA